MKGQQIISAAHQLHADKPENFLPGEGGRPSPFAQSVREMLSEQPGHWEMQQSREDYARISDLRGDDGLYRGIYRLADGELIAFNDRDVMLVADPELLLRGAQGQVVGVRDPDTNNGLSAAIAVELHRQGAGSMGPLDEEEASALESEMREWVHDTSQGLGLPQEDLMQEVAQFQEIYKRAQEVYSEAAPLDRAKMREQFLNDMDEPDQRPSEDPRLN